MAISNTLRKMGQVLSGCFLGLMGSWLLVICLGGLLTLGVLSAFHLGVLLSLGCMGVCLLVAGVCWFCDALSKDNTRYAPEDDEGWPFQSRDPLTPRPMDETLSSSQCFNPQHCPEITETSKKRGYHPFG